MNLVVPDVIEGHKSILRSVNHGVADCFSFVFTGSLSQPPVVSAPVIARTGAHGRLLLDAKDREDRSHHVQRDPDFIQVRSEMNDGTAYPECARDHGG